MKVTDVAVSTVFITTKGGTEVAQDCFVLFGFGPVPLWTWPSLQGWCAS